MRQPMSFFDTTPTGRILNRYTSTLLVVFFYFLYLHFSFGADQFAVDVQLPGHAIASITQIFGILVILFIIGYVSPIFLVTLIPLSFFYKDCYSMFMSSTREFMRYLSLIFLGVCINYFHHSYFYRLKGISRSPILSLFQESLNGLATIRAFGRETDLSLLNQDLISRYSLVLYSIAAAQRWFSLRLEFLGAIIVFLSTFFSIVIFRNTLGAGFVGLSITYALQLSGSLNWLTRSLTEAESAFISVERIVEYTKLETEAPLILDHRPRIGWPDKGFSSYFHLLTSSPPLHPSHKM